MLITEKQYEEIKKLFCSDFYVLVSWFSKL